jgi:hypothetical protein
MGLKIVLNWIVREDSAGSGHDPIAGFSEYVMNVGIH